VKRFSFELKITVEARDAEEARIIALEKMLDALNDPDVLKLVEVRKGEEE